MGKPFFLYCIAYWYSYWPLLLRCGISYAAGRHRMPQHTKSQKELIWSVLVCRIQSNLIKSMKFSSPLHKSMRPIHIYIYIYIDPIGDPIQWLHPFLFCTACCVSQVCYRSHYNTDLALGASREFTFSRVSAGIQPALYSPMHSIHKSRLQSIPNALRLTKRQIKKRNVEYCR